MIENLEQIYAELEAADKSYIPDKWQKQVLEHDGNIALRTGRQAGKSETIGKKGARLSVRFKGITILMVAAAQRQSSEIFQKTLKNLWRLHEKLLINPTSRTNGRNKSWSMTEILLSGLVGRQERVKPLERKAQDYQSDLRE
jgi:hypothetical protein